MLRYVKMLVCTESSDLQQKGGQMLKLNNVTFSRGKKKILENLSFKVGEGECAVLVGANGTGKSTALSLIADVIKPASGNIEKSGKIGYVPQESALFEDITVLDNLKFFAKLAKCQLPDTYPFSVNEYLNKRVSTLSGGMKKQVSIACALLGDPRIMLLDEPCSALDITFRDELIHIVEKWKNDGKAAVYVGHDPMEFMDFFDYLVFIGTKPRYYTREELSKELADAETFAQFYKRAINNV